jgi:hypothetical protein
MMTSMRVLRWLWIPMMLVATATHAQPADAHTQMVQAAVDDCRNQARGLRREASDCRRIIGEKPGNTCVVTEPDPNGGQKRHYTPAEADQRAKFYDDHALRLVPHVATVKRMEQQVRTDEAAIQNLGFDRRAHEFAILGEIAEKQAAKYEQLRVKTLKALKDLAIGEAGKKILPAITAAQGDSMIARLRSTRFFSPAIEQSIRRIQTAKGEALAKAWDDVLDLFKRTREELPEMAQKEWHEAALTVLSWGLKDPALKLLVVEVEWAMHTVWQAANGQLNAVDLRRLTTLTENDLKHLTRITQLMAKHVRAMLAELKTLKGCGSI